MDLTLLVVLVIGLALLFDFTNGFHDTANAMATPIATGALTPRVAVGLLGEAHAVELLLLAQVAALLGLLRL